MQTWMEDVKQRMTAMANGIEDRYDRVSSKMQAEHRWTDDIESRFYRMYEDFLERRRMWLGHEPV